MLTYIASLAWFWLSLESDLEIILFSADVSTWFGVTFKQDSEWRDRFHDYVRNRTVFPFWTGKILAGKLWQDLLQESRALLGPIRWELREDICVLLFPCFPCVA